MNRKEMLKRLKAGENPLDLSIEKWQDIADGKGKNLGGDNCALCETHRACKKCPVDEKTGTGCENSPYDNYYNAGSKQKRKATAIKEVEFLKSLRKEVTSK